MSDTITLKVSGLEQIAINGLVVYPAKPPDPPMPDTGDFPPVNINGPWQSLGWTNGTPMFALAAAQNFSVLPSQQWLSAATKSVSLAGGGSSGAGQIPAYVRYTIAGISWVFNGGFQSLANDGSASPPMPNITGPFGVTVEMFDANKQPVGAPYGVYIQLNHTP